MWSRLLRPTSLVLCLAAAAVISLSAQQPASRAQQPAAGAQAQQAPPAQPPAPPGSTQQQPTFRTGVRVVRVDVTATGRNDQPVGDLQARDFDVTEDGVAQRIEQFQFVRLDGQPPRGDDRSLEINTQDQAEAEAARDDVRVFAIFLDDYHIDKTPNIMVPLRRVLTKFVGRFWPTDLVAIMDPLTPLSAMRFTRSHAELVDVITRFEGRQGEFFPVRSAMEEAQLSRGDVARVRAEVTLSALHSLVVRLGGLKEGRKAVIFVSQGPPTFFGRDGNLQDLMRDIAQAASRGNVTIYPVDPRGLGTAARGARDTLFQLAAESGGRAITDTNDPTAGLTRILNDTSAYYVLGYQPTRLEDDGKYHKIGVKVKRPGVHLLSRQGYWAPSGKELETAREAAARTLDPGVSGALQTLAQLEPTRRPADVWIGMSRGEGGLSRVAITWEPADTNRDRAAPLTALDVEAVDAENGAVLEPVRTVPGASADGPHPPTVLALKPGTVSLRFTVRSEGQSVVDRWAVSVIVPDFEANQLSLSTPRVYRARSLTELRAINASPDSGPDASRRFARSDRVVVAFECYAPAGGAPEITAQLLARDGRELAPLPLPPTEGRGVRFELPIGSLGQGTYILRLRASLAGNTAEQHVAFTIVG
jgi:VWFA-related protein